MGEFKPTRGESIQVQGTSGQWAETPRVFITMHKGCYLCEQLDNDEGFVLWPAARPVPLKPKPTSYSHETWPNQIVHIRKYAWDEKVFDQVTGRWLDGVTHEGVRTTFDELTHHYLMSFDWGVTWQPCHYVPESEG